jgi:hypothetical protein
VALGGTAQLTERQRDQRGLPLVDTLMQDIRYALRGFRRAPGSRPRCDLALGIGLNTTVFSLFNAIALKRLPVKDPDRVVRLERWFESGARGDVQYAFSYEEYVYYRAHSRTLSGLVAVSWPMVVAAGDTVLRGQVVSDDYFTALGVNAARGRLFHPSEHQRRSPGHRAEDSLATAIDADRRPSGGAHAQLRCSR